MIALVIDTALGACSVAAGDETAVFAARYEEREAGQAELLIPMIEETLREAGLPAGAVTRIGVTVGPGSFTGTRIGLAAARAMGVALDCPVLGITTLEAVAAAAAADCAALVAFDARRDQIYAQMFAPETADGRRKALTPPLALSCDAAARSLPQPPGAIALLGSAASMLAGHLPKDKFTIMANEAAPYPVAARFLPLILRAKAVPRGMPQPLYLRPADAAVPGHKP